MPSEVMNGTAIQAGNGMMPQEVANSGNRVLSRCLGSLGVDLHIELVVWKATAEKAIQFVETSKRTASDVTANTFASMIYELLGGGQWLTQSKEVQTAYEAVARLWFGQIGAEIRTDAQAHEDNAVRWFQRKNPPKPVLQELPREERRPRWEGPSDIALVTMPSSEMPINAPPRETSLTKHALSPGFRSILLRKQVELEREAERIGNRAKALKKLSDTIGPEHDEALWELFGEILTQGDK